MHVERNKLLYGTQTHIYIPQTLTKTNTLIKHSRITQADKNLLFESKDKVANSNEYSSANYAIECLV